MHDLQRRLIFNNFKFVLVYSSFIIINDIIIKLDIFFKKNVFRRFNIEIIFLKCIYHEFDVLEILFVVFIIN